MLNENDVRQFSALNAGESEHLKTIIDNINGGVSVVVYDTDEKVRHIYANNRYYEIFGYTKEQFLAELKEPHDTLYPEDSEYAGSMIENVKSTHKSASFKYRAVKRDGTIIYIRCSSSVTSINGVAGSVMISVLNDITDSEESEQLAVADEHRLHAIMENISNGVTACKIEKDGTVNFLFATDRYFEILGYTREQFKQEISDPFKLIYPDDVETVKKTVMSMTEAGDVRVIEFRAVCRDGRMIWLKDIVTLMRFPGVEQPVQLGVFTDITDLKETELKLLKQQEEMTELVNNTPGGIAVVEVDSGNVIESLCIKYFNERFFGFSGYKKEEYVGLLKDNPFHFACEKDIPNLVSAMEKLCAGDIGDSADITLRCNTKDGSLRWLLLKEQLVKKYGEYCTIHIVLMDITERKQAIDKQRISEEMLRIAAETDKRAIIIYDVKANTCQVESRNLFSAKFGSCIENIPESLIELGIAAPDSIAELTSLFERIRQGEKKLTVSLQMRTGTAEYQWFECNAAVVFDADGEPDHAVLVFHNITEQRVKEAVYKKWKQSIEMRTPDSYTLFRCNLSRDASLDEQNGNLLKIKFSNDAMSFNQRTKEYAEQSVYPDDREEYIAILDSDVLLSMFYRGKHGASLEYREMGANGEILWRLLTVELVEYLNSQDVQAFLMYEDINERKLVELKEKEMAETDPLTGVLNRSAFAEKVDELIAKAPSSQHAFIMLDLDGFKKLNDTFGHAAGDQALIDVVAVLRSLIHKGDFIGRLGGDEFIIWLCDIPYDAVISKMAQMVCEQVHKEFSDEVKLSVSLGVSVYPRDGHGFDELYHNADKALYSVKQAGKNNYAFFSSDESASLHYTDNEPPKKPHSVAKVKRRMLIVDDSETNRLMLEGIFKDEYQIEQAKNGADAMVQLRHFSTAINVVLLDLFMPGMDGFEVLRKMQTNVDLTTIPVIVVSGDNNNKTLLKAIESGATDFVTKPVDPELIRIRVKSAVSKSDNDRLRAQNSYLQLQRDEELKFHTVLESTGTVVVEYNWRNHVFIYDGNISKHIAGNYNNRSLWTVFLSDMVANSKDVKSLQEMMHLLANDRQKSRASKLVQLKTNNNVKHWFRMNVYKQVDAFGLAEKMIITFNDVHEDVLASDKLQYQAQRDELTGLYNRYGFIEKATELIAQKKEGYYVLTCIDIEKFKVINDQYGTQRGDEVLKKLAAALTKLYESDGGICCRITADNFAALFPVELLESKEIEQAHKDMLHVDASSLNIKFTIGRCVVDDKSLDVSAIYDRACIARDTIKGRYDEYIATYDESMRTALLRQQEIIGQMNHALESRQFEVWLQPQFNHSSRKLYGAEALVRWRHPIEGIISPAEFIPLFEKNGFVYEVDKYVWEQVCIYLRKWLDQGLKPVPISVNISRYDVFRNDLIDIITGLVKKYDVPIDLLRLEITESAFSESTDQIIRVVDKFVELGFIVEIDDFGSGYSSLNTLKDVPAQVIKMDMRFLENDTNAQRGGSIIESIVRMAHWLSMTVIAEGVETVEQADYLSSIGCYYIQGYLYSRPIQVAEYEKMFADAKVESKYTALQSVETWNNNAFWNPKSIESLIFNSYVGGACIFEYNNGTTEILRTNPDFRKELRGLIEEDERLTKADFIDILNSENRKKTHETVKKAAETKEQASCELLISRNGQTEYIRMTIRLIATTENRMLFYAVILNVTEQREAEHRQIESAQQLEIIMNNINGGVSALTISDDGRSEFIFANERYYEIFGYTSERAKKEHLDIMTLILPEDFESVMKQIRKLKNDGVAVAIDYRCKRQDGRIVYIRENCDLMHMDGYGDYVITSVVTDITELREVQQKESDLSKQLQAIMANIHGGVTATIFHDNNNVEIIFANDGFYELYGFTKSQMNDEVGNVLDLILPEDRAQTMQTVARIVKNRVGETYEYRCRKRDGTIMWTQVTNSIISMNGINDTILLSLVTDITALRKAQQNELETAGKLHTVMQHAGNGITALALDGDNSEFIFINDKYFDIIGYTREEYSKMIKSDFFAPIYFEDKERIRKLVMGVNSSNGTITLEYRVQRNDGNIVWIRSVVTITELAGYDCPVQIAIFSDITAEKESENRQRELLDNLPCGAALYDFDGKSISAIHINKQFEIMTGRKVNSGNTELSPLEYIHPDDRKAVLDEVRSAVAENRNGNIDIRLLYGKNEYHNFHADARITKKNDGSYQLYVTYTYVSEQEVTLKNTLPYFFSAMMEDSTDITFAKDRNYRYISCSQAYARVLGIADEKTLVGKTDYELFSKDFADRLREEDKKLVEGGVPVIDKMETMPSATGLPYYTRTSKHALRDTAGNVLGIYGVGRDITERQETSDKLKIVTNSIPGGLASYLCSDAGIKLVYCNDGFCKLFGMTLEEYEESSSSNPMSHIFEQDRNELKEQYHSLMTNGTPIDCIYRIHVCDGSYKWIHHSGQIAEKNKDTVIVNAVLLDITEQQEAQESLRVSEELNRLAIEHSGSIITRFDVKSRTLTLPEHFTPIFNIPHILNNMPEEQIALGRVSEETASEYTRLFESIIRGEKSGSAVYQQNSTKGWRWLDAQFTTVFSSGGEPVSAVISFSDVTEQFEKEIVYTKWQQSLTERNEESYTMFRCNLSRNTSFDSWEGKLLNIDFNRKYQTFNELTTEYSSHCVSDDDKNRFAAFIKSERLLREFNLGHRSDVIEYREKTENGMCRWLRLTLDLVEYPNSKDVEVYFLFENIDEQKKADLLTLERAETDPLTGVLNRTTFIAKMQEVLSSSGHGKQHALFMLDVDDFKHINDSLGHGAGDEVLRNMTQQISGILRHNDLLGRLGGDEFFVLLIDIPDKKLAAKKAEQICSLKFFADKSREAVTASIGIAMIPTDGVDFDTLYKKVDAALYRRKEQGKNGYTFVTE